MKQDLLASPRRRTLAIVLGLLLLLLLLLPAQISTPPVSGSSYQRSPDGYAAWYAFMEDQGAPIQRWRKPLDQLPADTATVVQVFGNWQGYVLREQDWVQKGNTLVILGVPVPATGAPFQTVHTSPQGEIQIETRRRNALEEAESALLQDPYGSIVWQETLGEGRVIYASTPFLAANAYQDHPANFQFLANLVTEAERPIWVDEYLHGYRDPDDEELTAIGSWLGYLMRTPLLPICCQGLLIVALGIWALNRRFGQPLSIPTPQIANSEAYIQALAGVLQKAESADFVLEVVGKTERQQIQQALGFGSELISTPTLLQAWVDQTGRPAEELASVLQAISSTYRIPSQGRSPQRPPMTAEQLQTWLHKLQWVRSVFLLQAQRSRSLKTLEHT
jgi:hypothetical protein